MLRFRQDKNVFSFPSQQDRTVDTDMMKSWGYLIKGQVLQDTLDAWLNMV